MFDKRQEQEKATQKLYILGFVASILLTFIAYFTAVDHLLSGLALVFAVVTLGVAQALVQFVCFLHLGRESKPRWNLIVFLFMVLIGVVLVFGSLWIMYNLDYRMMETPRTGSQ